MFRFYESKRFFKQYGCQIGYTNDDLLYWYFSQPVEPTIEQIRDEVHRRMDLHERPGTRHNDRKNRRRRYEKTLAVQLASVGERIEILRQDARVGIGADESLATKPIRLSIIRELRVLNPRTPASQIWVPAGLVLGSL